MALAMFGLPALGAEAPVDAAVYARAERLLPPSLKTQILNPFVVPNWLGQSDEFWYRRQLEGGHEFVIVSAATGARQPAFDHSMVAGTLAKATQKEVRADRLPFDTFAFNADRSAIAFTLADVEYTVPLTGGAVQTRPARSEQDAVVSPDGRWAAISRDGNLQLRDTQTGAIRALTTDGQPDAGYGIWPDGLYSNFVPRQRSVDADPPPGLRWSPDGARIFVPFIDQRQVARYPMIDSSAKHGSLRPELFQPRLALVGDRPATVEWYLVDVATGDKRRVELPTGKMLKLQADILPIAAGWWRGDGAHLYVAAFGDNMESAFLFDIEAASGKVRTVLEDRVLPRTDLNTTSYNLPNVWVSDDGRDALWFSQRDGWGHLYLYDVASGKLRNRVTRGDWLVRDIVHVDQQARVVYFAGAGREPGNPYHRRLYRVRFDGGDLTLLTSEAADHMLTPAHGMFFSADGIPNHRAISPSGKYFVHNYSAVDSVPRAAIRSTRDGRRIAQVEEADISGMTEAGWRAPEEFVTTAADGKTPIYGVLYKPSDFDPAKKYPVLDAQYASPLISVAPRNFNQSYLQEPGLEQAAYAELGFIVVTLDGRGTPNRSKDFSQVMYGKLNTNGLDDHVAAIRELAAKRPYMDAERVGVYGISYGGYMTIRAMLEYPDFYKAGVAMAAIAVMPGMYSDYHWSAFHGRPRYADGSEWRGEGEQIPSNWAAIDARKQAARLQGKLYLQFSELDENVLPGQTMAFIDALIAEGKPFDMLYIPGRNHFILREPYPLQRSWDFMVRHLQGREPPSDFKLSVSGR